MPSNDAIIKLILELDAEAETDGKSNAQLATMLSELKAAAADKAAADKAAAAPKKPVYYVAPRKALTSKRGILSGDTADEVKPEYLAGGQEALDDFVKSGHILKG